MVLPFFLKAAGLVLPINVQSCTITDVQGKTRSVSLK